MDVKKIFVKNACPTKIGGQAVLEGLMMKGPDRQAIAIRKPSGDIHLEVQTLAEPGRWKRIPVLRGIGIFLSSLVQGTRVLMHSAEILEEYTDEEGVPLYEKDRMTLWLEKHFGEKATWNIMVYTSVLLAILLTVGVFIILPTWLIHRIKMWSGITNVIGLNALEGTVRIAMFVLYIRIVSGMQDIRRVFQYHGAEHKTIHCYESGLPLTPENVQSFYTLHPRCGTSFLMFVMVLSLLIFSLFGWPNLVVRITMRLLLLPLIAGLSYELLQFTGRHDGPIVRFLSLPGIALQTLTTKEPTLDQIEVAIAAMEAVLPPEERAERAGRKAEGEGERKEDAGSVTEDEREETAKSEPEDEREKAFGDEADKSDAAEPGESA